MKKGAFYYATFGSGCFWCTEALFRRVRGVQSVTSGYSGGNLDHPTYDQVCTGSTGHAEVVQILFNASEVSYEQLVEIFFLTHDPTTRNRQGHDIGTNYRSVIFVHGAEQRRIATDVKNRLEREGAYQDPIVTEIEPFRAFFPAEEYHQRYYEKNPELAYCQAVISPKVARLRKRFSPLLRDVDDQRP